MSKYYDAIRARAEEAKEAILDYHREQLQCVYKGRAWMYWERKMHEEQAVYSALAAILIDVYQQEVLEDTGTIPGCVPDYSLLEVKYIDVE